ncbi:MAG: T9SS type A sorting domain-containing protein [Bacteroidales bacterium]|nr:T9SS type A sorting domain-containing protein [Bacteroidales bacterium]
MRKLLKVLSLSVLMMGAPIMVMAEEMFDGPEAETVEATLSVNGRTVRVCGANGSVLNIYNVAGVVVASYRIDSNDKTIETSLSKGPYIFKVGKIVRKVSIKC